MASIEPTKKLGGRQRGNHNWKPHEIDIMLHHVKAYLPIGSQQWDDVTAAYNSDIRHPQLDTADTDRVKNKFTTLYSEKKPTGTGVKDKQITIAQTIQSAITAKVHGAVIGPVLFVSSSSTTHSAYNQSGHDSNDDFDDMVDGNGDPSSSSQIPAALPGELSLSSSEPQSASSSSASSSSSSSSIGSSASSENRKRKSTSISKLADSMSGALTNIVVAMKDEYKEQRLSNEKQRKLDNESQENQRKFELESRKLELESRAKDSQMQMQLMLNAFTASIQTIVASNNK